MRQFRNIVTILFLLAFVICFALYISAAIFVLLVWGPQYLDFNSLQPSLANFPLRLWPTIFDYIYNIWVYSQSYSLSVKLKLSFSVLLPFSLLGVVFYMLRAPILDWRPFKKKESVHGDARWANEREVRKIGLRSRKGLLLGKDKRGFLIAGGFQHALLFAPTGSGKGVGFVIPNLLFWEDSVVVHDIKLENFQLTSGYRKHKMGQNVYCWSPADPDGKSHCYNPLDWVSPKPGQMVDDVQKIANLLMPEQDFWVNEARSLFLGVVLYILAVPEKIKSFGEVVRVMRSDDVTYSLAVALDTMGKKIHPVAYMNIAAFLQKADKERSGVVSTMNSSLELWANPLIDTTTATSDFNFMRFKRDLTTVYVGLTPDNLTRLQPLMQVFYQQATEFLCRSLPSKEEPYGVLFMMDEFPTLGEMEQFKTGIAYFRGYNVRLFLIIQDTEQLKGIYEEAGMNSFLSNSTYRVTFAANNMETANLISQLVGNKTVAQESLNKPKFLDLNPASRSLHVSETQRALLLPQEVIMLPRDEQILLIESTYPIKSKKIKYYEDKFFTRKLIDPIPTPIQEPFDPKKFEEEMKAEKEEKEIEENKGQTIEEDQASLPKPEEKSVDENYEKKDFDEENLEKDILKEEEKDLEKYAEDNNEEDLDDDEELEDLDDDEELEDLDDDEEEDKK